MRPQCIIRYNCLGNKLRALWLYPRVDVRAVIAIRPPVKPSILNRSQVVGNEVAAELVPFVDDGPQLTTLRLPSEPVGIAQTGREYPRATCRGINLEDGGAARLVLHAIFSNVAIGADGYK